MSNPAPAVPPAKGWLFAAESNGIQQYILRSDPLREMVGGSGLVEDLPRRVPSAIFDALGIAEVDWKPRVLMDSAGAFHILLLDAVVAHELAVWWPLVAGRFAPGLDMTQALIPVDVSLQIAMRQTEKALALARENPCPSLPPAPSVTLRHSLTGQPCVRIAPSSDNRRRKEWVPEETARKRHYADGAEDTLRCILTPVSDGWQHREWPKDLRRLSSEADPESAEADSDSYVAVVHIDVNDLGRRNASLVNSLPEDMEQACNRYREFSNAVEESMRDAARAALAGCFPNGSSVPFRPLVCAGEDFTAIIRAAEAVQFTQIFLTHLGEGSRKRLKEFDQPPLTAGAGVVFCKASFPFARAYGLAESLCALAKRNSARVSSAIAFHRIRTSDLQADTAAGLQAHDYCLAETPPGTVEPQVRWLTMNPYHVWRPEPKGGNTNRLAQLTDLLCLARAIATIPRGSARNLVSAMYRSGHEADLAFARIRQTVDATLWEQVETALSQLTDGGLWTGKNPKATPWYDALELVHLGACAPNPSHADSPEHPQAI